MSWQTQIGRGVNQPGETKTKVAGPTLKQKEIKLQKIGTYFYDQVQMHPYHLTHNI